MHASLALVAVALPLALAGPLRLPGEMFAPRDDSCDLTGIQQPSNTMTPPAAGLQLALIARGQGTQNYTCADATSKPASFGALANLFNASCTVASGGLGNVAEEDIGMHFFADATTPEFDIIGLADTQLKKVESMAAPKATDVPWLKLDAVAGSTSPVKEIYRLNTAGGVAPADCSGQQPNSVVTVSYSAEYWVYASPEAMAARRKRSLGIPVA